MCFSVVCKMSRLFLYTSLSPGCVHCLALYSMSGDVINQQIHVSHPLFPHVSSETLCLESARQLNGWRSDMTQCFLPSDLRLDLITMTDCLCVSACVCTPYSRQATAVFACWQANIIMLSWSSLLLYIYETKEFFKNVLKNIFFY